MTDQLAKDVNKIAATAKAEGLEVYAWGPGFLIGKEGKVAFCVFPEEMTVGGLTFEVAEASVKAAKACLERADAP